MSAELPQLCIQRQIVEGRGRVIFTYAPSLLQRLLEEVDVSKPDDLPHDLLREFCHRASHAETRRSMEDAEQRYPGSTVVVIGDEQGNAEIRSSDLGFEVMERFIPPDDDEMDMLCNPQYCPVDFELRVFDNQSTSMDPARNIGRSVLYVTLKPPNLA